MKQFEDLKEGNCTVLTLEGKEFEGYYSAEYNNVFFTIPYSYTIIGYLQ